MKSSIKHILPLVLLFAAADVLAQAESTRIILDRTTVTSTQNPLFIFKIDNKEVIVNSLLKLDSDWIKNVNVIRPSDALEFGSSGVNGVVIVEIKPRASRKVLSLIRKDSKNDGKPES